MANLQTSIVQTESCEHQDGFYVSGTARVTGFATSIQEFNEEGIEWTVGSSWDEELTCAKCKKRGILRQWLDWIGKMP